MVSLSVSMGSSDAVAHHHGVNYPILIILYVMYFTSCVVVVVTHDIITILEFSVSWQIAYFGNVNTLSSYRQKTITN